MLMLKGILRQAAEMTFDKAGVKTTKTKVWLEHTSERDNGVKDIKIEELFLEGISPSQLPKEGEELTLLVRVYAVGNFVKYAATGLVGKLQQAIAQKNPVTQQ